MLALIIAGLTSLITAAPLAPLNPLEQDTLPGQALHITAGVTAPNGIVSPGTELSAKYEMLVIHPLVLRGGADLKYAQTVSNLYPRGHLLSLTGCLDALYYRGTEKVTAYIGLGGVFTTNHFSSLSATADSLLQHESITSVDINRQFGYRITLGLRLQRHYSIELAITEIRPDFVKHGSAPNGVTSRVYEATRTGTFRITFGYVFKLSRH